MSTNDAKYFLNSNKLLYAIPDPGSLSPGSFSIRISLAITAAIIKDVKAKNGSNKCMGRKRDRRSCNKHNVLV